MTCLGLIQKQAVAKPCGTSTVGCRNLQDLAPTRKLRGVKNGQKERRVSPRFWGYCAGMGRAVASRARNGRLYCLKTHFGTRSVVPVSPCQPHQPIRCRDYPPPHGFLGPIGAPKCCPGPHHAPFSVPIKCDDQLPICARFPGTIGWLAIVHQEKAR